MGGQSSLFLLLLQQQPSADSGAANIGDLQCLFFDFVRAHLGFHIGSLPFCKAESERGLFLDFKKPKPSDFSKMSWNGTEGASSVSFSSCSKHRYLSIVCVCHLCNNQTTSAITLEIWMVFLIVLCQLNPLCNRTYPNLRKFYDPLSSIGIRILVVVHTIVVFLFVNLR